MKPVELTYQLPKDAKAFIVMPNKTIYGIQNGLIELQGRDGASDIETIKKFIKYHSPLQVSDEFYFRKSTLDRMHDYEENGLDTCMDFDELMSQKPEAKNNVCVSVEIKELHLFSADDKIRTMSTYTNYEGVSVHLLDLNFISFIDSRFGQGTYDQNPYVFLYTFKNKE